MRIYNYSILVLILTVFIITGCAKWVQMYPSEVIPYETKNGKEYEKNYRINEAKSTYVGQPIIFIEEYDVDAEIHYQWDRKAILTKDLNIKAAKNYFSVYNLISIKGNEHSINNLLRVGGSNYNMIDIRSNDGMSWSVLCDDSGNIYQKGIYSRYFNMLFYPWEISINQTSFEIIKEKNITSERRIRHIDKIRSYELVYSGKNNISLNFLYREYTGKDLARPAFTQNLTYQASAGQIRFKDFVIQIHYASNELIAYTVLEDGLRSIFE